MTSEKEIQQQLDKEIAEWNGKIYDGYTTPKFNEMFKAALMHIPVANHKYSMKVVKEILSKRHDELNMVEVPLMINIIYNTPWEKLYSSIEEAIATTEELDKIRDENNRRTTEFETKMMKKRQRLMSLGGVTKETHIIPATR